MKTVNNLVIQEMGAGEVTKTCKWDLYTIQDLMEWIRDNFGIQLQYQRLMSHNQKAFNYKKDKYL